jgi:hypothetical protein
MFFKILAHRRQLLHNQPFIDRKSAAGSSVPIAAYCTQRSIAALQQFFRYWSNCGLQPVITDWYWFQ